VCTRGSNWALLCGPSTSPLDCTSDRRLSSYRPRRQCSGRRWCYWHGRVRASAGSRLPQPRFYRITTPRRTGALAARCYVRWLYGSDAVRLVWLALVRRYAAIGLCCTRCRGSFSSDWRLTEGRLGHLLRWATHIRRFVSRDTNCSAARKVAAGAGAI